MLEIQEAEEANMPRTYIIAVENVYKFYWDVFVIILAIYNALALPLMIAFPAITNLYEESTAL